AAAGAGRRGISDFNTPFRVLIRSALILYAGPGLSQHEVWNAITGAGSRWSYGSQHGTEALPIVGIPVALAVADQNITLPSLEIAPYDGEPASVEEQPPSRLLQGLWTTVQWAEK